VVTRGDELLVRTRPEKGLLGGMTEVPTSDWLAGHDDKDARIQAPALKVSRWHRKTGVVTHVFTHFPLELVVYVASVSARTRAPQDMRWVPIATLKDEALPNVMRKVIAHGLSKTALFRVDNCHYYSLACHLVLQVYCSFEKPTGARRCENLCLNFSFVCLFFSAPPQRWPRRPMTRRRFSPNGKRISIRGTWTLPSDCTRLAQRSSNAQSGPDIRDRGTQKLFRSRCEK
jgi:hypothetical protein